MMSALHQLRPAERQALGRLLGVSLALGLTMSGVTVLANEAVQGGASPLWGVLAGALVLVMAGSTIVLMPRLTEGLVDALTARRVDLIARLRSSELRTIEGLHEVESQITRDQFLVDQLPSMLGGVSFLTSAVLFNTLYVFVLSPPAGVSWLMIVAGLFLLQRRVREDMRVAAPQRARAHGAMARALRQRVNGFAQLLFDAPAREASRGWLRELDARTTDAQAKLDQAQNQSAAWGEDAVLVALAVVLFRVSELGALDAATLYRVSTVVLAMSGFTLVVLMIWVRVQLGFYALGRLTALEQRLGPPQGARHADPLLEAGPGLHLSLRRLGYTYEGESGFAVGPVDLELKGGQLVIIRGGNGCGKTTLMKTIAGLYAPSRGALRLGDRAVHADDIHWYRDHITAIFTGQHLFERPYGLGVPEEEVNALLERFGLAGVTRVRDGRFTRIRLSSGQSKRLAMVVALLEKRPILLLDEWDSHQDPGLRRFYYEELLPELTAQGKLVIVVSHDARRFALADVLLHIEGGQVVKVWHNPSSTAAS